jgi:hypothetical protein
MDMDMADPAINNHLADMMQGNQNDEETQEEKVQRSLAKSKQKKSSLAAAASSPQANHSIQGQECHDKF